MFSAMRPAGPEITRRALLRRPRQRGVRVVALPAGHDVLGAKRPMVDRIVAEITEINADLRRLSAGHGPTAAERPDVLSRPIPGPGEGAEE
jgi:hypothetical protein